MDEPFLSPGISERQPLHVVMVKLTSISLLVHLYIFSHLDLIIFFPCVRLTLKCQTNQHDLPKSLFQLSCSLWLSVWFGMTFNTGYAFFPLFLASYWNLR